MCGINGIFSREKIEPQVVQAMTQALRHRGPDYQNTFLSPSGNVALGHTRLSIIDLSPQGHQPMYSSDGRYVIVFNGEIYNFKNIKREIEIENPQISFRSSSDTEVIIHAFHRWGTEMVKRLEGMFAIAIYDNLSQKLFLFRDRMGKKPIFYFCNHTHFIFASEIKSLLHHPVVRESKEIDKQAIHEFLHLGYISEPKTIYRSIRKFPAGHIGEVWNNLSFKIYPFWAIEDQFEGTRKASPRGDEFFKRELHLKLHEAVKRRLISDVPLGAFLSGGTDSSLISAIASRYVSTPLKTFTIGFRESKFDEHHFASQVAKHLKTDHHEYILSENEAAGMLHAYLDQLDEPFADTSTIPTMLVSKMARKEVTVALTGDGGDELFLGYGTYSWAQRLSNPLVKLIQSPLATILKTVGDNKYKRISHVLEPVGKDLLRSHIFSQEQYFFSDSEIRHQLLERPIDYDTFRYSDFDFAGHSLSAEELQSIFDLKYYLKDDLLVKIDRSSMLQSLECRSPLLDTDIIHFVLNAPLNLKRRNGITKWILKEILKEYLPSGLIYRQKWGFSIPLSQWLKNELHYLMKYLDDEELHQTGLFKLDFVKDLIRRFNSGEDYLYNRIWALIIVQRFLKNQMLK
ncbi:MAG TPA: asparagine synthase (glutamine-hydrolyzing) [Cyclobacteriaceae bacterium]|jgi:asparagine synthase (glutamine-hydrolysing)|nr:asparagine synthase (glutamine-hydrolyzing) [Cyclobacteriaceae bacterium]